MNIYCVMQVYTVTSRFWYCQVLSPLLC